MSVLQHGGVIAAAAILLLSLGCTKSCSKKSAAEINTITVDVSAPIESLDPRYATSAAASRVAKLVYAPLFEFDENLAPKPFLAESFAAINDTTYKFTLKPNLTFHDGSPLTAEDAVYTFAELASPDVISPIAEKLEYVKSIKVVSELEFIVELEKPYAPFLTDTVALGVVSKKSCLNRSAQCRHEFNGSGPFRVEKWDTATETLLLTPNAAWFEGPPAVKLNIRVVRDENTRVLELLGQKAHIIDSDISPQNIEKLSQSKFLKVSQIPGLGFSYLAFNVRGAPSNADPKSDASLTLKALATPGVRQAIAQGIDFEQIIQKIFLNTAHRASGLIPNGHWAKDPTLLPPKFDPEAAQKLLDDAGFKKMANGYRFKLTISSSQDRTRQNIAMLYVDYLKRLGIDASVRVKDWSALYQDMKKGQFEVFSAIWVPVTDPDLYMWVHHSSNIPSEGKEGGNRHGFKNLEIDALIEKGRITLDQTERTQIYQEIERRMLRELPYIPLWNENRIVVINQDVVTGYVPTSTGSLLGLRKIHAAHKKEAAL
jgi:peptide/nickel transport system substrate-binding protein